MEQRFDITIELRPFTRGDVPPFDVGDYVYVTGIPLADRKGSALAHQEKERELLRWSKRLAKLIDRDPSLMARARRHVERVLESQTGPS